MSLLKNVLKIIGLKTCMEHKFSGYNSREYELIKLKFGKK